MNSEDSVQSVKSTYLIRALSIHGYILQESNNSMSVQ